MALNTGFQAASDLEPEAIVILDGDCQHRPEKISQVLSPLLNGEADVVVGSRYLMEKHAVPFQRILGHRLFTLLANAASGTRVTDSQSGFRAFSSLRVWRIRFSSSGFAADSEVQFEASDLGVRVCEVPISAGYEDEPKRSVCAHGLQVLRGLTWLPGRYRPLLFFGGVGILVSLLGLALFTRSVGSVVERGVLDTVRALIAIALLELGGYVKRVACDSRLRVTVGVINNQPHVKDYSIRIRNGDEPSRVLKWITLEPGQTWEEPVDVSPGRCGTLQSVVFSLLEGESESPKRSIYQRVLVTVGDELDGVGEGVRAP